MLLKIIQLAIIAAASVVQLDDKTFDKVVDGSKNVLVKFYAPWCGHCKNMAPAYVEVAENFKKSDDIVIAEIDADKYKSVGSRFDVKGFPTIKWFPKGSKSPEDYTKGRDKQSFLDFIGEKTGNSPPKPVSKVTVLDSKNFNSVIGSGKNVLVEFYAPWCGHCKQLAPTYEEVAGIFEQESDCIVANLDATESGDIAAEYDVQGYPTIKFFSANGEVKEYSGGRSKEDFVTFLNEECKTHRTLSGGLDEKAGLIQNLDDFATKFFAAASEEYDGLLKEGEKEAEKLAEFSTSKYYIKVLKKWVKNKDFIESERKRLTGILGGGKLAATAKDQFQRRINVLSALLKSKASSENDSVRDEEEL